jgi:hypothetical protein
MTEQQAPQVVTVDATPEATQSTETNQEVSTNSNEPAPTAQSRRLADMARRERHRVEAETRFKQERESWENNRKQYDPILDAVQQFKSSKDAEAAFKLLEASGISYEDLTDSILSQRRWQEEEQDKPLTVADIERIAEDKAERLLEQRELTVRQQREAQEADEVIGAFKKSIEQEAEREGADYQFVNNTEGSFDLVFDLVVDYYDKYQEVLPLEKAFMEVEHQLKSDYETLLSKYGPRKQAEQVKSIQQDTHQPTQEREIKAQYVNNYPRKEVVSSHNDEELSKEALFHKIIGQLK